MAELDVNLKPNVACAFKQGGFLEVRNKQAHCRVGDHRDVTLNPERWQITSEFLSTSSSVRESPLSFSPISSGVPTALPSRKPAHLLNSPSGRQGRKRSPPALLAGALRWVHSTNREVQVFRQVIGTRDD